MTAFTTQKRLLTALKSRMKGIKPRSKDAQVTITFQRDGLAFDALTIPAEAPEGLHGTACTLNGFLLLEIVKHLSKAALVTLDITAEGRLCLQSGSFTALLVVTNLTRPIPLGTAQQPAPKARQARPKRPTKRFQNLTPAPAYTEGSSTHFLHKIAL